MKCLLLIACLLFPAQVHAETTLTGQIQGTTPVFFMDKSGRYGFSYGQNDAFQKLFNIAVRECQKTPCQITCDIKPLYDTGKIKGIITRIREIVKIGG